MRNRVLEATGQGPCGRLPAPDSYTGSAAPSIAGVSGHPTRSSPWQDVARDRDDSYVCCSPRSGRDVELSADQPILRFPAWLAPVRENTVSFNCTGACAVCVPRSGGLSVPCKHGRDDEDALTYVVRT
jgi:hypothetical protein